MIIIVTLTGVLIMIIDSQKFDNNRNKIQFTGSIHKELNEK
jgi:hypothetical protein